MITTYTHSEYAAQNPKLAHKWDTLDQFAEDCCWGGIGIGEHMPTDPSAWYGGDDLINVSNWEVITNDADEKGIEWTAGEGGTLMVDYGDPDAREWLDLWDAKLASYPIADEEHYSELELEVLREDIARNYWGDVRGDAPDEWVSDVIRWLGDNGRETNPDYMQWDTITEAIEALGYSNKCQTCDGTGRTVQIDNAGYTFQGECTACDGNGRIN